MRKIIISHWSERSKTKYNILAIKYTGKCGCEATWTLSSNVEDYSDAYILAEKITIECPNCRESVILNTNFYDGCDIKNE